MSSTASSRTSSSAPRRARIALLVLLGEALGGCVTASAPQRFQDDFASTDQWVIEAEDPRARVTARAGALDIDTPAGLTAWFRHELVGPVRIEFDAIAVSEGGANDHVSDLNVFWMASERDGVAPFPSARNGRFAAYDDLHTYYVGLGGNRNTTTRFRRYIGQSGERPLRPEHDLTAPDTLLVPNQKQTIVLIANRSTIEYLRDGRRLFHLDDPAPYTRGWFAIRTTASHLRIERLRIEPLERD